MLFPETQIIRLSLAIVFGPNGTESRMRRMTQGDIKIEPFVYILFGE